MVTDQRPNFLVILADDLGYSDIGCFGGEIKTPNIDSIFEEGCKLTDYHATAACSPTRAILLSGTDNHIAGVGTMSEMKSAGGERWNVKGHEGFLNHDVVALPELLQEVGYRTLISGKWHLGLLPENNPQSRGFDRSLALLPGCSNHYGWEPQFGPSPIPFFERIPPLYTRDGVKADIPANTSNDPKGFYSSDYYVDNLLDYLDELKDKPRRKPFFAYLPFTAPHWPLQCSKEDRDAYKGVYDEGPDVLRLKRLEGLQRAGIYPKDVKAADVIVPEGYSEWDDMTEEEKKLSARSMEVYAGMVTSMDRAIGRVLDYLRETGELDNTLVIFKSDNGAEGAAYEAIPVMGPHLMKVIDTFYDNSLENVGNHDSFVWYGARWAAAATAPHRLHKMYSTEGGIRVPFVMRYPRFHPEKQNGAILRAFSTVADICPTILELAGVQHPVPAGQAVGRWRGRKVAGVRGKSWVKYMQSSEDGLQAIHTDDDPAFGWELFGRAALRKGKYKILHVEPKAGGRSDGKWSLYDISIDPGETNDLSEENPEVMKDMLEMWEAYVQQTGTVWGEDKPKIGERGSSNQWGATNGLIGGDALEQTRAWMKVGKHMRPDTDSPLASPLTART